MKKYLYSLLVMFAVLAFASCQDDLEPNSTNVKSGLPARLSLSIQVPSANKVVNSRGVYDYESEVTELALIMFEEGGRKVFINLTGELETSTAPTEKGGRTYTLSKDIEGDELSGNYQVYAIANWSSPFCGMTLSQLESMSEYDLNLQMATNANYVTSLSGTERLPMTYTGNVEIKPLEEDSNGTTLSIQLKRITSHIIFNFKTEEGISYTPLSYTVYNMPKQAFLINRGEEENLIESGTKQYAHSSSIPVSSSEFEFFMLENVCNPSTTCESYEYRDKWSGGTETALTKPEDKKFVNAPENSTFVVVKGEYSDNTHFGEVSYTIHLGDFSNKDWNNFTVNRNEKHTYTVTIKGVTSITTEAKKEDESQPGAEGELTTVEPNQFVLDSHYETVMLKIPTNSNLLAKMTLIIKSPYHETKTVRLNGTESLSDVDYQWVKFMKPESATAFPKYDADKTFNVVDLATALSVGDVSKLYKFGDYYYVAAFVDEYYYDGSYGFGGDKDWTKFVNKDNRVMVLNPDVQTSTDGNSTLYPTYLFSLSQRSIKTTYALDKSVNAFGIETWNESGSHTSSVNDNVINSDNEISLSSDNGYANTQAFRDKYYNSSDVIDFTNKGYFDDITDNSKGSHVYTDDDVDDFVKACLSRNRDTDGDGMINDDELKWYVPSLYQFLVIWLGEDLLTEDTKLFNEELIASWTTIEQVQGGPHYYTSSGYSERLYWASQGVSWNSTSSGMSASDEGAHEIRCVRDLKTIGTYDYPVKVSSTNQSVIEVGQVNKKRTVSMKGEYGKHTERSVSNYLPESFQVANADLETQAYWGGITGSCTEDQYDNLIYHTVTCAEYTQDDDGADKGEWRIPNQREMIAMVILNEVSSKFVTSTWYTVKFRPGPFAYGDNMFIANEDTNFPIRCVRDGIYAPASSTDSGNDSGSSSSSYSSNPYFENGGDVISK